MQQFGILLFAKVLPKTLLGLAVTMLSCLAIMSFRCQYTSDKK